MAAVQIDEILIGENSCQPKKLLRRITCRILLTLNSVKVWLLLAVYLFVTKNILDTLLYNAFADPEQPKLFWKGKQAMKNKP